VYLRRIEGAYKNTLLVNTYQYGLITLKSA